jgi:RNA polymerase sigma-70 factor (ECF subfamily)
VIEPKLASEVTPPPGEVSEVVEHLFRHEGAKMVATLARIFGLEHLSLAEDVVQEALARALQTWPFYGVPDNPAAWIMRASRNLALDVVRREKVFRDKEPEIARLMETSVPTQDQPIFRDREIADDRLRLMFVCCHPLVPAEAQAALALKTLCGFSVAEISRAFLTTEAAIAKRLTRAKQKIREAEIPFEIPAGEGLAPRLDGVLQVLYLLFNEGYKASSGEKLVRQDVCREALRLTELLAAHPAGNYPRTRALLALMLFNAARLLTRMDIDGNLVLLKDQDRSRWDQPLIARGMFHFVRSAAGEQLTQYHLEAAIAACHCAAEDYASTDWIRILSLYDQLIRFDDSPVVALNRAVALGKVAGPEAAIEAVGAIRSSQTLESYYLLYAVLADFEVQLEDFPAAASHLRKAIQFTENRAERALLEKRLRECELRLDEQSKLAVSQG